MRSACVQNTVHLLCQFCWCKADLTWPTINPEHASCILFTLKVVRDAYRENIWRTKIFTSLHSRVWNEHGQSKEARTSTQIYGTGPSCGSLYPNSNHSRTVYRAYGQILSAWWHHRLWRCKMLKQNTNQTQPMVVRDPSHLDGAILSVFDAEANPKVFRLDSFSEFPK